MSEERQHWRITIITDHDEPGWCGGTLKGRLSTTDPDRLLAAVNAFAGVLDGIAVISHDIEAVQE